MTSKTVTAHLTLFGHYQTIAFAISMIDATSVSLREPTLRAIAAYFGYKVEKL